MKNHSNFFTNSVTVFLTIEFGGLGYAQQPTHVPSSQNNSPINLNNWFDITVYIILPICMVLFYFLWRRQIKKDKDNNENKK